MKQSLNIRKLKLFAFEKLPKQSLLREIILSEPDELDAHEFIVKVDVWLKLLKREYA